MRNIYRQVDFWTSTQESNRAVVWTVDDIVAFQIDEIIGSQARRLRREVWNEKR